MERVFENDREIAFPPPPVVGTSVLVPIASWQDMLRETALMRVEFDAYWLEVVEEGVAYFFRWLGEPRCTVLVVWTEDRPTHIECRGTGDLELSPAECLPIVAAVTQVFRDAGFWRGDATH
jgi:hypothetical protein